MSGQPLPSLALVREPTDARLPLTEPPIGTHYRQLPHPPHQQVGARQSAQSTNHSGSRFVAQESANSGRSSALSTRTSSRSSRSTVARSSSIFKSR
jgi:hypothetical protein